MTTQILVKGVVGLSTVGAVSVGSLYFGTNLFTKKISISSLIKNLRKDKRLITSDVISDPHWKAAWKRYREGNNSREKDIWELTGWKKSSLEITEEEAIPDFLRACKNNRNREVVDSKNALYKEVESYCTRDTLISDLIIENNFNKRLLRDSDEGSTKGWKGAWALYKSINTNKSQNQDKWRLSDWSSKNREENAPDSFKNKCRDTLSLKGDSLSSENYTDILNWCTENKE